MNHTMNLLSGALLSVSISALSLGGVSVAKADTKTGEAKSAEKKTLETDDKGRAVQRDTDQRPDETRGWFVVAKATYWPLCYDALDRLEESRALVGKGQNDKLALSLEKNAAWLGLAASAAMTNGHAGINSCADRLEELAIALRNDEDVPSDQVIHDCITLGELCMAKSHVLRADAPDQADVKLDHKPLKSKATAATLKEAEKEIRRAQMDARIAQYRYDAGQSVRHLAVAQAYLQEAAKAAGFAVPKTISAELPEADSFNDRDDITEEYDAAVRPRTEEMLAFIDKQRKSLIATIDGN
ncbi:secreted protein [Rhodopirellula maiorica SM1]|uniref:Secreted protein n=1 Tax=Rhodopirellula maiorica SM1 TaxID=1265738 RepID=M5RAC4_9BACT|nr:hypothetical protein [Rhodopirellula maiorica]EMI16305.1 secreted protein [Rhodopirellula maiorica SM1]